eukprot:SAG11_NODE_4791_length_1765_cov_2.259304_2_plen_133_part_00
MFCLLGLLALALGKPQDLHANLKAAKIAAEYKIVHGIQKFQFLKYRGYDSLKLFFECEKITASLPAHFQELFSWIFQFIGASWFIVSNPYWHEAYFQDVPQNERHEHASEFLREMAEAIHTCIAAAVGTEGA